MRIGFISGLQEEDFRFAAEHGFPCMETNITTDAAPLLARKDELKRCIREYKVDISHIGMYNNDHTAPDAAVRKECAARLKALTELCADLGVPIVTTGGGFGTKGDNEKSCRESVEVLGPAVSFAKTKGVRFSFYNCHWGNHVIGPKQWEPILKALPEAGIKFDPSHPYYDNEDYLQQMLDWGHRFLHMHAKGCVRVGGRQVEDPPPGFDMIQWGPFFAILYKINYRGDLNIEPHSKTWSGPRLQQGILLGQRFLKQYVLMG